MSLLNAAISILVLLNYSLQIISAPTISSNVYDFPNRNIIIGNNHIDKTTLVYALCQFLLLEKSARCRVILDASAFSNIRPVYFCDIRISTEIENGRIHLLGVDLWGESKAIITWIDQNMHDLRRGKATIQTMNMSNCQSTMQNITVDNRIDRKPQIFVLPYETSYVLTYADRIPCGTKFCKVNVYEDGLATAPISWFQSTDFIHALESIKGHSNKILITVNNNQNTTYYLLNEMDKVYVGSSSCIDELGWSTDNNYISFCNSDFCKLYTYTGGLIVVKRLHTFLKPIIYESLYNLPDFTHLAVICNNQPRSYYRIIRIGLHGHQIFSYTLEELFCSRPPERMSTHFFRQGDKEYCLALFYTVNNTPGRVIFSTYCFVFEDV